jgi:uncharacterized protein YecE (DUF72 family)
MLAYYSARFSTVEINYTFYRMPTEKTIAGWVDTTPDDFTFTLKASRRITHDARLKDCADMVDFFWSRAQALGPKLGVLLFQLPPWFRKDLAVLDEFLDVMPRGARAAFEFRHKSWLDDDVYGRLRAKNLALCITDSDKATTPVEMTADYAYFRLRDEVYKEADIARWGDTVAEVAAGLKDAFVYFKHEKEGKGAEFARTLIESLESR